MTESHPIGTYIRRFLLEYVVNDRCLSRNTQKSYRDTIRLLLQFLSQFYSCDATQLTVEQVTADAVRSFLTHRQKQNGNSAATRNQRLATIHSLIRFAARQTPELLDLATQVQNIPLRRVAPKPMPYLEKEEIDTLLATPDRQCSVGRRDYVILLFLYNTGARAQEVADVLVRDLNLDSSAPCVRIRGKGNKTRICPLWPHTAKTLRAMLGERVEGPPEAPVFLNIRSEPITRYGIHTLVERTVAQTAQVLPSLRTKRVSPHTIRHTTAVHLLRSGVDINTIRAWLGHVSLETTNRYAEVDLEMKAKALMTCAVTPRKKKADREPLWRKDRDLMDFLASL
jgi:site-specific recombinase XerD